MENEKEQKAHRYGGGAACNMAASCAFYLLSSAGMSIFNKLAITVLPLPISLVIIQMAFTVFTTLLGWRSIHMGSRRDVLRWSCTVPLLFNAMLVSSMFAMQYNTLGTVAVFRNIAPLVTLLIERCFRVPMQVSVGTVGSLLVIVLGVVLYHFHTLQLSWIGFASICLNMVFAVLERLLQRHLLAQAPVDISKSGLMLLNNACGLVPNIPLLFVYGEHAQLSQVFSELTSAGWGIVALSCLNGVAISYAGLRVQQLVTATTFMVLTNVNKFLVILFGVAVLQDQISFLAGCGVVLATAGALLYARARQRLQTQTEPPPPPPPPDGELELEKPLDACDDETAGGSQEVSPLLKRKG